MRRIITVLGLAAFTSSQHIKAQQEINFGDFSKPVPSVSSLATYANTPISNATGIPDISFSLLGLPTYNRGISLNVGLSYNPMNVSQYEPASQTGTGWSLFAGGVISRSIINDIDEMYDDTSNGNYTKNNFDDIYYYSLPGISGKFKFKRDTTNNTFELINLSSNKLKIEYIRTSNTATLILESFTITDTKGIKYIFNDHSKSNQERNVHTSGGKIYKSAFFLTQIKDANNTELANFSYQKDIKYKNNGVTLSYQTCKLKTITSPGFGKVEFEYLYEPSYENTMNDPYQVQKVILKDNYNHVISGYAFEYTSYGYHYQSSNPYNPDYKRILAKLKKIDKNGLISEVTEFEYGDSVPRPSLGVSIYSLCSNLYSLYIENKVLGILKKVITPTKGVMEYTFESNQNYKNRAEPSYVNSIVNGSSFSDSDVQYLESFNNIQYDTNQTTNYTFTISGNHTRKIYVVFGVDELFPAPPYWEANTPTYVDYMIKSDGNSISATTCSSSLYENVREYDLAPGGYTLMITGSGGRGTATLYGIEHTPLPFPNAITSSGVRVASIKYYNSKSENTPVKIVKYDYSNFLDSNSSSGFSFSSGLDPNANSYILYKNVKISETDDNNGYVKYYYKTPNDYPKNGNYWPYYSFTNGGLLERKEIYNAQNQVLVSEQNDYTFEELPNVQEYELLGTDNLTSKLSWLKKSSVTSTSYFDNNQSIEQQSETNFNVYNFEVASTKKIADGNTIEQFYTYPESGYTHLSNAHIISVPVVVEEKNDNKTVSKAETKYDNTSNTLPTSVLGTNISDGTTKTTMKFDLYDEKGNILQFTSSVGIPTAIVYGYDKTQPIAKIEGATYAQVSPYIQTIVDASNADAQNPANEQALLLALDNFRKTPELKEFQITTISYDPLIGITTSTPPDGIRVIYKYNAKNQLEKIVDMNGVILKEYQYNYKN
ncbi:hypothetical protein [Chryseobacterium oryctis]|uniref:YD repeat-containing protein n=1 Tax=Chryseobacterium oryctis TaxID=2952618 RepID=A0ABT3HSV3_9FLAO|nr:hypothetical protein [Chryseobacterium oryctis]MCW3162841.1 hypothetical protein [Chryseobacterium oryctis]